MKIIAPSMLSSDFGRLVKEIELINDSSADWFHLDVMDGVLQLKQQTLDWLSLIYLKQFHHQP